MRTLICSLIGLFLSTQFALAAPGSPVTPNMPGTSRSAVVPEATPSAAPATVQILDWTVYKVWSPYRTATARSSSLESGQGRADLSMQALQLFRSALKSNNEFLDLSVFTTLNWQGQQGLVNLTFQVDNQAPLQFMANVSYQGGTSIVLSEEYIRQNYPVQNLSSILFKFRQLHEQLRAGNIVSVTVSPMNAGAQSESFHVSLAGFSATEQTLRSFCVQASTAPTTQSVPQVVPQMRR
jgi:hypothetical protein